MIGLRAEDLSDFQKNSIGFEKTDKKQIAGRKGIDGFVRIELFKKTITVRKQQSSCLLNKGEIK